MKFSKKHLSKLTEEGHSLLGLQATLQAVSISLLIVLLGILLYFLIPVNHRRYEEFTAPKILVLTFSAVLLGILNGQLFLTRKITGKWMDLERRSVTDPLTGVFNHVLFDEVLDEELRRAGRYHYPVTLCVLDLDDFRSYNTHFGRTQGDGLLHKFSVFLSGNIRFVDCLARYSNDEFCILLPHTDLLAAQTFITRILTGAEKELSASFSAGLTLYRTGETRAQFLMRAINALELAKRQGKKKICCVIGHDDHATAVNL